MYLEQQVEQLKRENEELKRRIESLEQKGADRFVTAEELAEIMGCSTNTVYVKVRAGEIEATKRTGGVRIPMSQFYVQQPEKVLRMSHKKDPASQTLKERVFG